MNSELIFEKSKSGRRGYKFPQESTFPAGVVKGIPEALKRVDTADLPEVNEVEVIRHYVNLSRRNYGVDIGFYPLGSCTMKYNPKINEDVAALEGFSSLHPLQPVETSQGMLALLHETITGLCEITGMAWGTLQPFAGAQGEFTGMKLFAAYFAKRGETKRKKILVPDSSHGTNPASAHIAGFEVVELVSDSRGMVSPESIKPHLDDTLAGIMMTNPNTLGIFEEDICTISTMIHDAGGLLYYDGANLNAIMGKARPGDMGFDVVHLNLHKTFSTPHGGGGPGSGAVFVNEKLIPFLPVPDLAKEGDRYTLVLDRPDSIGKMAGFFGNIGVVVRAWAYIQSLGKDGLERASELAVLNANYLKEKMKKTLPVPFDRRCKHEFVLSAKKLKEEYGVSALDIAKGLLDYGVHPPTIYFPLIVPEALMVEPTETESQETLDLFAEAVSEIVRRGKEDKEVLKQAPIKTVVRRIDEVLAAKKPVVNYKKEAAK